MSQIKVDSIVPRGGLASGTQGGIIQMKYTPVRSVISNSTSESGNHVSAFDTAITPLSSSSRIIIQWYGVVSSSGGNTVVVFPVPPSRLSSSRVVIATDTLT